MKNYWKLLSHQQSSHFQLQPDELTEVLPLLSEQRLEGLVYSTHPQCFSPEVRKNFSRQWQSQWLRNHLYLNELSAIEKTCQDGNVKIVALKGAALLSDIYSDLGSRPMSDLDLLISPESLAEFRSIMQSLGYREKQSIQWQANSYKATFLKDVHSFELVVEVHTKLFRSETQNFDWQILETSPRRLHPTDQLFHLIGHLSYQHTFLKLFWLVDIDRYIRRHQNEIDWQRLFALAQKLETVKALKATLWATHKYLGTPLPHDLQINPTWIQKYMLTEKFLWGKKFNLAYYLIKHDMKDSLKDAFSYNFFWLLLKIREIFTKPQSTDK